MTNHSKDWSAATLVAAALVTALAACGGSAYSTAPQSTNNGGNNGGNGSSISVPGTSFDPSTVTITAGGTVTWVFSGVTHNVHFTGTGAPSDIPDTSNGTVTRTFNTKGTFTMTCSIHAGMTGTITVQ